MKARDYEKLANDCDNQKNYDEAILNYNKAIEFSQDITYQSYMLNNRALVKNKQGSFHDAIEDYTIAITLNRSPIKYWNRGETHLQIKNWKKAIEDFSVALALYSSPLDRVDCHIARAIAYKTEDVELAKSDLELANNLILENKIQGRLTANTLLLNNNLLEYYAKIKTAFTNQSRLAACFEGEVPIRLTDLINKHSKLMNEPVLLTCCGSTTEKDNLSELQEKKNCPCCHKPFIKTDFTNPIPNLSLIEIIKDFLEEKEILAWERRNKEANKNLLNEEKEGEQPGLDNPLQNIEVEGQPANLNAMNNLSSSQNVSENGLFARSIPSKDNPFTPSSSLKKPI